MKISCRKFVNTYLIVFGIVMLIYCSVNQPKAIGEWDDYSLPIASILEGNGFAISESDIVAYKTIFPEWAEYIDHYKLSPYTVKNGGTMTWYFPIYSIACIPFTLLLQVLNLPTVYTFPYTNLAFFMISLYMVWKYLYTDEKKKIMLIVLLSLNPIVYYTGWPSAEMLIYSLLVMAFIFWYNRWYKRAAIFVSIAGMMNPTIMSIGFFMIAEYLIVLVRKKERSKSWFIFLKEIWIQVLCYGACYIIGIIPMAYNYYNTGHINLTASLSKFTTQGSETTLERFFSYLFDLNYGILPYFCIILVVAFVLCIPAILYKKWRYLEWITVFAVNVLLYSVMIHINSGMAGIARYNAWGVLPLLFAVCMFFEEIPNSKKIVSALKGVISLGIGITCIITLGYGDYVNTGSSYMTFAPIAKWFLDHAPALYNPLPSTFYSRNDQVSGGYSYALPVIYYDDDGFVRKILLDSVSADVVNYRLDGSAEDMDWLNAKVSEKKDLHYLSISPRSHALKAPDIIPLETIWLSGDNYNADQYAIDGISGNEINYTWTKDSEVDFDLNLTDCSSSDKCYIRISVLGLINDQQQVILLCNGEEIYNKTLVGGTEILAPFSPADDGSVRFSMLLPDALEPTEQQKDQRHLALSLTSIAIEKKLSLEDDT